MSRPHPLLIAAGFFSAIPAPPLLDVTRDDTRRAVRWLPTLGAWLGLVAALVASLTLLLSDAHLLAAVLAVGVLQLLVGAMHLDGLADTCDGLAALGSRKEGRDAARALEIMRRPDVGAMGVTAILLVLATQLAALSALADWRITAAALVLGPATGRLSVLAATLPSIPAARPGGFGALMSGVTPGGQVAIQFVGWLLLAAGAGWWAAQIPGLIALPAALLLALLAGWLFTRSLVRRFGGLTGDCFGALVEFTTTCCWVGLALLA